MKRILLTIFLRLKKLIVSDVSQKVQFINEKRLLIEQNYQGNRVLHSDAHNEGIVVSLTTFGSRINSVFLTIESLFLQSLNPSKILLWLSEEEFSETNIPVTLKKLESRGLDIRYCPDIRSYKKLIPTLEEFPDRIIITVDDDAIYGYNFVHDLVYTHRANPNAIICLNARLISSQIHEKTVYQSWKRIESFSGPTHRLLGIGVGGVLYPPNALHPDVFDLKTAQEICPIADDIWFKFMAYRVGSKYVMAKKDSLNSFFSLESSNFEDLGTQNIKLGKNEIQLEQIVNHYNIDIHKLWTD